MATPTFDPLPAAPPQDKTAGGMLKVLAMESGLPIGVVALLDGGEVVAEARFSGREGHVVHLPMAANTLFHRLGWQPGMLDLIVVTTGPGAFAGLRVALGFAKGISLGGAIPLVGISTATALAAGVPDGAGEVVAVLTDARRGELFFSWYRLDDAGFPETRAEPRAISPSDLPGVCTPLLDFSRVTLTGNALVAHGERLRELLGNRAKMVPESGWEVDGGVLGRLGIAAWRRFGPSVAARLEPGYGRLAEAESRRLERLGG
ncbi:MAG: tRNA (adenosine(37)-N6)-threonylcarbamoyltransferase complex dimerization subunit type 1 TsaB [Magnetococcales bacterium]|nr:tRNA (adenosine(37)-N6)-threonylcarbamoyltransferase complex dimerization subunit type 1 TsaB [Magnetococcales bacterium]MBF0156842.1 tRNA (adenosine(37)-N6)-threonylcarbamoyltransferase complex dimerization subunit type 1 TsaB [Magnetococcales bacterium]